MKTIKFTAYPDGYRCSEPNDQSGDYVKAEIASSLMEALKALNQWWESDNFSRRQDLWDQMRAAIAKAEREQ